MDRSFILDDQIHLQGQYGIVVRRFRRVLRRKYRPMMINLAVIEPQRECFGVDASLKYEIEPTQHYQPIGNR